MAKFRKCSLKVGYRGVCYRVENSGNIAFILNIKQRLCNYKMNILFIGFFYFSHVNRFFWAEIVEFSDFSLSLFANNYMCTPKNEIVY